MPRFFFNIRDGFSSPDDSGTELQDWAEARVEAVRLAGALIKDDAQRIALGDDWHIEVADSTGLILFQMSFITVASPVLRNGGSQQAERSRVTTTAG
ncbi:DUF6894 family protein [Methylobacterium sp. A49B]